MINDDLEVPELLTFQEIRDQYVKLGQQNKEKIEDYQQLIQKLEDIYQNFHKIRWQHLKGQKLVENLSAYKDFYALKSIHYFGAHLQLLKTGFIEASYSALRSAFEAITKTYLFIVQPELNAIQLEYDFKEDISQEQSRNIEKQMKIKGYLGNKFISETIYSKENAKKLRELYKYLCYKTHPNFKGMGNITQFHSTTFEDSFMLGLGLAISTVELLGEIYNQYFTEDIKSQIKESFSIGQNHLGCYYLLKPDLIQTNLVFKTFEEFQIYLKTEKTSTKI